MRAGAARCARPRRRTWARHPAGETSRAAAGGARIRAGAGAKQQDSSAMRGRNAPPRRQARPSLSRESEIARTCRRSRIARVAEPWECDSDLGLVAPCRRHQFSSKSMSGDPISRISGQCSGTSGENCFAQRANLDEASSQHPTSDSGHTLSTNRHPNGPGASRPQADGRHPHEKYSGRGAAAGDPSQRPQST